MEWLFKALGPIRPDEVELLDESIKEGISENNLTDEIREGDVSDGLEFLGKTFKDGTDGKDLMDQILELDATDRKGSLDGTLDLDPIEGLELLIKTQLLNSDTDLPDEFKDN